MKNFTTRFLLIGLFAMLCFSYNSYAQLRQQETSVHIGHLVRTTPVLSEIDRTSMYGKPFVRTRDENGIIGIGRNLEETEERVEEKLLEKFRDPSTGKLMTKSGAIQKPGTIFPQVPGTTLGVNFDGQQSPGLQPTDNNMAAGPNNVIQMVNDANGSAFTIWNKSGVVIQPRTTLASVTGFPGYGDPVVLYDQLADRWLMAEFGPHSTPIHNLNIAVSTSGNPTGSWKIYQYQDVSFFIDYPKYSVWHNAYYATSNDFDNAGASYLGSSVYSMDRAAMLSGAATATMIRTRLNDGGNNYNMGTIGLEGMTPSTQNGLFAYPVGPTTINVFEVTPNFVGGTQTIGPNTALTVASFSAPPGSVPMQGGGTIQTLGQRMMFKLNYRNNSGIESIVMTHSVGNGALAAVRWYELRRVAGNWTVYQQGTITGSDGNSRFMGGISMDGQGNIALMYDVSGTSSFPSIKYTARNPCDPLGQMTLPEATIINASSNCGCFRWGDYNTTVQDYSSVGAPNDKSFWSTSQYGNQLTRIANYTITNPCAGPVIQATSATLTAEGCAPNNGAIDPTETVTVNFCLQNVGTVSTSNLVATLQATGGVVSPSGPQTYGVVASGGPSVCMPFTFSNSGLCGGTITATLQLQDGANNLGTVSYTFTLGVGTTTTTTLPNGDFETGSFAPWVIQATNPTPVVNTTAPHTGTYAAFLGNAVAPEPFGDCSFFQPITVPASGGTLSFWYKPYTTDGITFDWQDAYITNSTGTSILATIMHVCTGTSSTPYQQKTYDLSAFAGQNVGVKFLVHQDGFGDVTDMYVDDITITSTTYSCCGAPFPPCTITCPANITTNNSPGFCGANVTYNVTGTGACGNFTGSPNSGSFFPVGTTTVNVSSQSGATCSFTVTVNDGEAPVTTCPGNQTRSTNVNVCTYTAVGSEFNVTATDNCTASGSIVKNYTLSGATTGSGSSTLAGVVFNKGITTVNWTATDAVGNSSGCSFTVTVNDNQVPSISCPANVTKTTAVNVCTYTAVGSEFDATFSDNCPGATNAYLLTGATTGSGAATLAGKIFNTGVTTIKWTATDASGNTSTCSFTLTLNDGSLPIVTQPTNQTVCEGSNATFTVVGTSGATLTYQWQQWNGSAWVNVAGATSSTYTINSTAVSMNTNTYRVNVTTVCGNTNTSNFATLYVNRLPMISLVPSISPALLPGQTLSIAANVSPAGGTIVWYKNGVAISNATSLTLGGLTVDDQGTFYAVYTDLNGCSKTSGNVVVSGQASDNLWVYPNPNTGAFQIRFYNQANQKVSVVIYDSKGARVYHNDLTTSALTYSRIDVNLGATSGGAYVVQVLDAGGNIVATKKMVIAH